MPGMPPPPAYPPPYSTGPPRYPYPHSLPPQPVAPPLPSAASHSFTPLQPPHNQVWGNTSWHQQQNWEQQDRNIAYKNEEDWAAKAKAWAAANSVSDNHPPQMQYTLPGKTDEQSYAYQDPYQLAAEKPTETQQIFSGNQQMPISVPDHQRKSCIPQESPSLNLESSSYAPDVRASSYGSRVEGVVAGRDAAVSPHVNFGSGSSFFEKEVSSSYSSISGNEMGEQYEKLKAPVVASALHGEQYNTSSGGFNDQPLVFEQKYAFDHDQSQKINYRDTSIAVSGTSYIDPAPPIHGWTPPAAFSHIPPSGQQFDSSFGSTSSIAGQPAPVFGRASGPNFHPSVSTVAAPFVMGVGTSIHGITAFPEDANGGFSSVERPKKPSVPNWLREELIKKKASIASSVHEQAARSSHSLGTDDEDDKPFGKGEPTGGRSMDSSRSAEDDEDDEDDMEAVRSAAINQEIKRVLTEILLKVTDELFEEIATRVLDEDDDLSVKVDGGTVANQMVPSPSSVTPKLTAKVTIPALHKPSEVRTIAKSNHVSKKGNILGLANYSSSDDDEEEKEDLNATSLLQKAGANPKLNGKNSDVYEGTRRGIPKDNESSVSKGNAVHNADDYSMGKLTLHQEKNKSSVNDTYPVLIGHHKVSIHDEINHQQTHEAHGRRSLTEAELESTNTDVSSGPNSSKNYKDNLGSENFDFNKTSGNYGTDEKSTGVDKKNFDSTKKIEESQSRVRRDADEHINAPRSSKDSDFKLQKGEVSESTKRNLRENDSGDREAKKPKNKEEDARKREYRNARDDQPGRGDRDTHRSKSRRSISPVSRVRSSKEKNNKDSSYNNAVSNDSKRKSHSNRRSLSRSPSRSRRRQASRSPNTRSSHRRHSPSSYSDKRRR